MKDLQLLDGLPDINSLSRDEENALATKPSEENFNKLVLHNMREAFFYARQCCRGKLPDDEIYSANYGALLHAARNFKPNRIRFFAYAKPYIRGGISKTWRTKSLVRTKGKSADWNRHCELYVDGGIFNEELGRNDEDENSDGLTGILRKRTGELKKLLSVPLSDPEIEKVQLREEYDLVKPLFKQLTNKEQSVIALRYKSEISFARIGKLLGTSREDIRITHSRALKKLHTLVREKSGLLNK